MSDIKWDVIDQTGVKVSETTLPESIFGVDMNESLLHTVIKGYQANRRQGTHATKTRSMVSGSGKKPFRQKGTGQARQGSRHGPHMIKGAVAHGPQPRCYRQHINKRMKKQALRVTLSDKVRHQKLIIINELKLDRYSTKSMRILLNHLIPTFKALVVDHRTDDLVYKSVRNLHGTHYLDGHLINAENILRSEYLVLTQPSLEPLFSRFTV